MGWPQHLRERAPADVPESILRNAIAVAKQINNDDGSSTPILTLGHLAASTGSEVKVLRRLVGRKDGSAYKTFLLAKATRDPIQSRGYRTISAPRSDLKAVQRWISDNILARQYPNPASKAYSPESTLVDAVKNHLRCRWLIKLDLYAFFDSISEIPVYRVFRKIGYQPLTAFELARLCTRLGKPSHWRNHAKWLRKTSRLYSIGAYGSPRIGHLPQGAPTSPMLSNLVMREFDERMSVLAAVHGFRYSRYADDLALSTSDKKVTRATCQELIKSTYRLIGEFGLAPNLSKTKISPPGCRKLLLGLLVDGPRPHLTKEFRKNLSQHVYYLKKFGPAEHANRRKFDSVVGLRNHVYGLAYYAKQIDEIFGKSVLFDLNTVNWPL
jgi:retron-type reverse transcriptase